MPRLCAGAVDVAVAGGNGSGQLVRCHDDSVSEHSETQGPDRGQRQRPTDAGGIVGIDGVNLSGNNLTTDSFDSADVTQSTNGKYDAGKAGDKGDVVSNSGLVNSVAVGNADVKGHVSTGPNGTVSIGSS